MFTAPDIFTQFFFSRTIFTQKQNSHIALIKEKYKVHSFVLDFMELPMDTLVSEEDILVLITNFVKTEINLNNNPLMFREDNREFNLIGKLAILFQKIFEIKKIRENLPNDYIFPTFLRYSDIINYVKYCIFTINDVKLILNKNLFRKKSFIDYLAHQRIKLFDSITKDDKVLNKNSVAIKVFGNPYLWRFILKYL
jgi:hypothetical protein